MKCPLDSFPCSITCFRWPTCSYVHQSGKGKNVNVCHTTQPITDAVVRRALEVQKAGWTMREFAKAYNVSRYSLAKLMAAERRKG